MLPRLSISVFHACLWTSEEVNRYVVNKKWFFLNFQQNKFLCVLANFCDAKFRFIFWMLRLIRSCISHFPHCSVYSTEICNRLTWFFLFLQVWGFFLLSDFSVGGEGINLWDYFFPIFASLWYNNTLPQTSLELSWVSASVQVIWC